MAADAIEYEYRDAEYEYEEIRITEAMTIQSVTQRCDTHQNTRHVREFVVLELH